MQACMVDMYMWRGMAWRRACRVRRTGLRGEASDCTSRIRCLSDSPLEVCRVSTEETASFWSGTFAHNSIQCRLPPEPSYDPRMAFATWNGAPVLTNARTVCQIFPRLELPFTTSNVKLQGNVVTPHPSPEACMRIDPDKMHPCSRCMPHRSAMHPYIPKR